MRIPNLRQGLSEMVKYFNPAEGRNLAAIIQFEFTGQEPGCWHFIINEGKCSLQEGQSTSPATLKINIRSEIWFKIMSGELNGPETFLAGQATATGDFTLLLKLGKLFSQPVKTQL